MKKSWKKTRKILKNARIIGLAFFLEKEKALVISDLHFGIEESFQEKGFLTPRLNYRDAIERLEKIFAELSRKKQKTERIIITGDLKHEFGRISKQEWSEVIDFLRFLQKFVPEIILIKGNHDTILEPIAQWEKIKVQREFYFEKTHTIIVHGDVIPLSSQFQSSEKVIIGHEHPAIGLREGGKTEKYKCFLKGSFESKTVIVLPSFNAFSEGTDLLQYNPLSPFLQNLKEFEVWAIEDKPYYFGKIGEL
ncbi:metallophosphoesterase [Patescibacteria group bacterium]|nr:metallophosphoesterase [Patescibacteria group bacterium]